MRPGRKQRPHLGGRGGVVEHDQRAGGVERGAQQGGRGVCVAGDQAGFDAQAAQQDPECVEGAERGHAGSRAVQVEEQLPVREVLAKCAGGLQGEAGLADAGHAADHRHGGVSAAGRQGRVHGGELLGPADETGRWYRQLGRPRPGAAGVRTRTRVLSGRAGGRGRGHGGAGVRSGVFGQDLLVRLLHGPPGLDPERVDEGVAQCVEDRERFGLPVRPVQREHQLPVEGLPVRVLLGQRPELGGEALVAAEVQVGVEAPLQ